MTGAPGTGGHRTASWIWFAESILAVVLIATALVVFGSRPFSLQGDNLELTYPLLVDSWRQLRAGHAPVWTAGRWGGAPLLGDPVAGALYVPYGVGFALTPFPHVHALDVAVALHLLVLTLGMGWFLSGLGAGARAAWIGTAILVLNPSLVFVSRFWLQYWAAFAWWPWLFGASTRLAVAPDRRLVAIATVSLAAQVYAGYPEFALYSGIPALAWLAFGRPLRVRPALAAIVGLGAIALSAPQILPGLDMAAQSIRGVASARERLSGLGVFSISASNWLASLRSAPLVVQVPYKIAPAMLLLAVLGVAKSGLSGRLLGAIALASGVLCLPPTPLHQLLYSFPPFSFFGAPGKFFYVFVFATASLSALGFAALENLTERWQRVWLALLAATLAATVITLPPGAPIAVLAALAGLLLAGWLPRPRLAPAAAIVAIVSVAAFLVAADPFSARQVNWSPGFDGLLERPLPASDDGGRLARAVAIAQAPGASHSQVGLNFGSLWGVESWSGVGPLAQARQLEVMEKVTPGYAAAVIRQIGADRIVVRDPSTVHRELLSAGFTGPPSEGGLRVLSPPTVSPRYELLSVVRFEPADATVAAARRGAGAGNGLALIDTFPEVKAGDTSFGDSGGRLEITAWQPGRTHLRVEVARPTWLLAREPYYENWSATIDDIPAAIHPASGFLFAVEVPAGVHDVILEYREPGFRRGIAIAIAGLLALPLVAGWVIRRST